MSSETVVISPVSFQVLVVSSLIFFVSPARGLPTLFIFQRTKTSFCSVFYFINFCFHLYYLLPLAFFVLILLIFFFLGSGGGSLDSQFEIFSFSNEFFSIPLCTDLGVSYQLRYIMVYIYFLFHGDFLFGPWVIWKCAVQFPHVWRFFSCFPFVINSISSLTREHTV